MLKWKLAWSLVPVLITVGLLLLTNLVGQANPAIGLTLIWFGLIGMWFGIPAPYQPVRS
jgi:hypothetical protein